MLNFYDFEVFKYDWLVVIINPIEKTEQVIVNDKDALQKYYDAHKKEIWVGFNSREYDSYILKGILCGFNPKEINDHIIVKKQKGWSFSNLLRKIPLNDYDVMPNPPIGLKTLEGFMGAMIKETDIPFNIDRKLTPAEIAETIKYCRHDVEQTIEVFLNRKHEFDAQMELVKTFKRPLSNIGMTESRITAEILECQRRTYDDEFDLYVLPCVRLEKYKFVADWFMNSKEDTTKEMKELHAEALNRKATTKKAKEKREKDLKKYNWEDLEAWRKYFYERSLTVDVCGVPHVFGWGGLHGAPDEPIHRKGLILHVDVNSTVGVHDKIH